MTHECFVVFGNRWYSYRSYERKLILKISSSLQGTQQNSLLTSFNVRHSLLYLEQFKFRRCRWISHNAIVSLRSYQNQFVMRINYNMFVIFAKAEQHAERYIKLKYPSRVIRLFTVWSNIGFGNPTFSIMCEVTWIWCTALHKTSHFNVSIAIDIVHWIHIEFRQTWTQCNYIQVLATDLHFLWHKFSFDIEKAFT